MGRSTDVKYSIAGFYYQLLIAVRELIAISEYQKGYVGVECAADVRVHKGEDLFIEAKFYKAKTFSRYDYPIKHTIFNFYTHYKKTRTTGHYNIRTNVPIAQNDKVFFDDWNKQYFEDINECISFIKDCLVYENIEKDIVQEKFKVFKDKYDLDHPNMVKPQYKSRFIEYLKSDPKEYSFCADPNGILSDDIIKVFIKQVSFNFAEVNEDKYDSVTKLKNDTESLLKEKFPQIDDRQYDSIRFLILDSFLDTTVDGKRSHVTVKELHEIVRDYDNRLKLYVQKDSLAKTISDIENEILRYEKMLERKGYGDKIEHILRIVNDCTEQYFQEIGKFGEGIVNSRYLMDTDHPNPLKIHDLFKVMGEIYSLADRNLGDVSLIEQDGINNFKFSNFRAFALVTSASRISQEDEISCITSFIKHNRTTQNFANALGNETIIMDVNCDLCKFDKNEIDGMVIDIGSPSVTVIEQSYYKSFDYKCTKCLRLFSKESPCEFSEHFKGGKNLGAAIKVT